MFTVLIGWVIGESRLVLFVHSKKKKTDLRVNRRKKDTTNIKGLSKDNLTGSTFKLTEVNSVFIQNIFDMTKKLRFIFLFYYVHIINKFPRLEWGVRVHSLS